MTKSVLFVIRTNDFFHKSMFFLWALVKWSHTFLWLAAVNTLSIWLTDNNWYILIKGTYLKKRFVISFFIIILKKKFSYLKSKKIIFWVENHKCGLYKEELYKKHQNRIPFKYFFYFAELLDRSHSLISCQCVATVCLFCWWREHASINRKKNKSINNNVQPKI